jgi:hypothetical protein
MKRNEPAPLAAAVTKHGNPVLPDLGYEPTENYSHYPRSMWCLLPLEGRKQGPKPSDGDNEVCDQNCDSFR